MTNNLNHQLIETLISEGKSYKEVVEITGYNSNSVYGWCRRHYGKMQDRNKFRRQNITISQDQKELIFGSLLGDCNIQKVLHSYQGRTNHCLSQLSYCSYKQALLSNLTYSVKFCCKSLRGYDKIYRQCYFCFKPNENLQELYDLFYSNGKKDVPLNLCLLTPQAMALWFMDDGTASGRCSISIATCGFSLEGLLRLQKYLKDVYNLDISIQKDFKIYFKAESARRFKNLIYPFMIDEMKYKFKYCN